MPGYIAQLLVRCRIMRTPGSSSGGALTPRGCLHSQRHLVKVTGAKWDAADAAAAAAGGAQDPARAEELAQQLTVAVTQLAQLGVARFGGADPAAASRELAWFAAVAWNAGLSASAEPQHDWPSAAALFTAAGAFLDAVPAADESAGAGSVGAPTRQLAWLLAAGASLEAHAAPGAADSLLADAQHALARCAAAAAALLPPAGAAEAASRARTDTYVSLLAFTAAVRACDESLCLDLLRTAEATPGLTPDTALKLARIASPGGGDGGGGNSRVALRAYELCLRVMQRTPGAPVKDAALVLRKVLTLAEQAEGGGGGGADSRDARVLRGYREAAALLGGTAPGAYPSEEAHWLVTAAWNRGALLAKLGRADAAEPLLKCALELLKHGVKHAPALEAHKAAMLECLVRRRGAAAARGAALVVACLPRAAQLLTSARARARRRPRWRRKNGPRSGQRRL